MVEEGQQAPDFELQTDAGETVHLSDFRGRPVVLYFYPRDDTSGCTKQACGMRDSYAAFRERGVEVLGVSIDTEDSHRKFKEKYSLPFTLLADPEHAIGEAYGVTRAGKETYARSTFVIDADGNIARVMLHVQPDLHAEQVLAALP